MKQSVEVEIAGQKLVIKSDQGPGYVQELADYVDLQLQQHGASGRAGFNLARVALLVAMQIADELFREKDLHRRYRQKIAAKLEALDAALREHEERVATLAGDDPPGGSPEPGT